MNEEVKLYLDDAKDSMEKAVNHLNLELGKIRAGKASPAMLEGVRVDYYGTPTPLSQVANVSTPDARTIMIQPWEKSMITPIEKAIVYANLGLTPTNDGIIIRINVPALTEDRRKDLVKKAKQEGENDKVAIRNIRRDANEEIKKLQKKGLPEDVAKDAETKIQDLTNKYIAKIDDVLAAKEKEIMTV
jgi:ribosome recycling factor